MKASVVFFVLVFLSGVVMASQKDDKVEVIPEPVVPVEGVVYSLPQTGIRIFVKATREKYVHGPYCQYAKKMLGIENVSTVDRESWVIEELTMESFSEPDPRQVFKAMGPNANMLSLSEDGILLGINVDDEVYGDDIKVNSFFQNNSDPEISFTDLSMWSFYTKADSAKSNKLISKNLEQKAAEAAETIFTLRTSRFNLLTNANDEPLPDGKSFEIMAVELEKTEHNYVELFTGKTYRQSYEYSFDYIPGESTVKGEVIFRFNEKQGVLDKKDLSGRPVVLELIKVDDLASKQKELSASENPDAGSSGVYYRMPGMAEVRLSDGIKTMADGRMSVAQFGTVAPIPESLLSGNHQLRFYSTSGAVKSITKTQ